MNTYYLLFSSYGARIWGFSNPVHEIDENDDFSSKTELICVCVYVCNVQACSETCGWAGNLLLLVKSFDVVESPPTGWVTVSHTDAVWDFFHELPHIILRIRRKWVLVLSR